MNKGLFAILLTFCTASKAELITYSFESILDDQFGTLATGTVLSGEFTFESEQSGTYEPTFPNLRFFDLAAVTVSAGTETIELKLAPDSHGWIAVDDGPFYDLFSVRSENTSEGIPAYTGTLGGLAVNEFYMAWEDTDGSANDGHSLPLDESTFLEYENAIAWLVPASYSQPTSYATPTNVSSVASPVPIPAAVWFFGSGLLTLIGITRRKNAA